MHQKSCFQGSSFFQGNEQVLGKLTMQRLMVGEGMVYQTPLLIEQKIPVNYQIEISIANLSFSDITQPYLWHLWEARRITGKPNSLTIGKSNLFVVVPLRPTKKSWTEPCLSSVPKRYTTPRLPCPTPLKCIAFTSNCFTIQNKYIIFVYFKYCISML